jgi:osmotically inducible protein OsmC
MANVERKSKVVWKGDLAGGSGSFTAASGAIPEMPVTWAARVERSDGKTSPEELIASAHATCYAMALSHTLDGKDTPPERLEVNATCTLDDETLKITTMDLDVRGRVSDVSDEEFRSAAEEAEQLCPVSNALRGNVDIRLTATLES